MSQASHDAKHSINALTPLAYLALLAGPHDKHSLAKILNVSTEAAKLEARRLEKMKLVIYRDGILWIASRDQAMIVSAREKLSLTKPEIQFALEGTFAPSRVVATPTRISTERSEADVSPGVPLGSGSSGESSSGTAEDVSGSLERERRDASWREASATAVTAVRGTPLRSEERHVLRDWLEAHGINSGNTTAHDAAELWYDSVVADIADNFEKHQPNNEESKMKPQVQQNQKSQNKSAPVHQASGAKPTNGHTNGNGATQKSAAPKEEPKKDGEKKAKVTKVKFFSTHKLSVDGKEVQADYTVRVLDSMVTQHGRPRDPWGDEMKLKAEAKGVDSAEKSAKKAARKVEKEQRAKEKEERKAAMSKMSDTEKKALAAKERVERQAQKDAKRLAERKELEDKIRAEMAAGILK